MPQNTLSAPLCVALLTSLATLLQTTSVSGQGGPATVVVAPVIEREVASSQPFVANVKPRRHSVIGSAVDGRVLQFLVDAGQAVEAGQTLAQLRTGTIEIEVAGAEAELQLRRAELEELRNGSRKAEIALAEATTEAANAGSEYAKAKLLRAQRLYENGSGLSQDELEATRAEALTAAARLSETKSSLQLVHEGPRKERIAQAAANVAVQEQIVAGLKDRLVKYTIKSPFKGYVATEFTEAGAWVRQGDPVADVVEIDPVEVEVFVPEASIRFVKLGALCNVQVEAFPDQSFAGKVDQIIPMADSRSRTFPVRILVDNPPKDSVHALLPGMLARVEMPTGTSQTRMLVPKDALKLNGSSTTLLKAEGDKAAIVPVRTGPAMGSWISVESLVPGGLKVGDEVVTRGNERLRPGQSIVISETQPAPK
ncbi:MAG: efflux RND transporter periplasmic adaptor subunit [Rubripirellula sp.]